MKSLFKSSFLIIFLLFGLSLIVLPVGRSFFEIPKVVVAELIIQILFLSLIFTRPQQLWQHLKIPQIRVLVILFGVIILSQYLHPQRLTLFGNIFRLQGTFLWIHLILLAYLAGLINLGRVAAWLPIATLLTLLTSALYFGKNAVGRFYGLLGDPNALGAMAVFCFPWIFSRKDLRFKLVGLSLSAGAIFLSGSRSALIAWLVEVCFLSLITFFKFEIKKAFFVSLILVILSLSMPFLEEQVFYQSYQSSSVYKFESRAQVWLVALKAGLKNPLFGWGFGNTQLALRRSAVEMNNNLQYVVVDSSHNILLDFWVQGGVVALGLLLYLIYLSIKSLLQWQKQLYLSIFLGLLVCLFFNPVSVVTLVQFWWLIGASLALLSQKA